MAISVIVVIRFQKWRQSQPDVTSPCLRHVVIGDCRRLQMCDFLIVSSGTKLTLNLIKIRPAVFELKHADSHIWNNQ
jgi:hypothetical protein